MLDHALLKTPAHLFTATIQFYEKALLPLSYKKIREIPGKAAGFGDQAPDLWIFASPEEEHRAHIALRANNRATVRQFHSAALAAGGKDNGLPGLREKIHEHCYAAFVLDPAGNNLEVVCHAPEQE